MAHRGKTVWYVVVLLPESELEWKTPAKMAIENSRKENFTCSEV